MKSTALKQQILNGGLDTWFVRLYGTEQVASQRQRYCEALERFSEIFGEGRDVRIYSAPGRTEVSGNHTDHNNGKVLAASVNLDVIAVASVNTDNVIRLQSKGYPMDTVTLDALDIRQEEINHSASLIRGMAKIFTMEGHSIDGFDAYTTSDVLKGSGLSSSAAFEVLVGTILSHLFNEGSIDAVEIAKYAQYAENVYFGKPSGLMDQMASSVGGMVFIDFEDPAEPHVERISFDFASAGHALCIIDSGADHAGLTDEYGAIPNELGEIASHFGKRTLREISERDFFAAIPDLRGRVSDRAILRAIHVYQENRRVIKQATALRKNDFSSFLRLVTESGRSSWMYLQNISPAGSVKRQPMAIALAMCDTLLRGRGAYRVHGGGFAGTVQAFVPNELLDEFVRGMDAVLGQGSCHVLSIRKEGGIRVKQGGHL